MERVDVRSLMRVGLAAVGAGLLTQRGPSGESDSTYVMPGFRALGFGMGLLNPRHCVDGDRRRAGGPLGHGIRDQQHIPPSRHRAVRRLHPNAATDFDELVAGGGTRAAVDTPPPQVHVEAGDAPDVLSLPPRPLAIRCVDDEKVDADTWEVLASLLPGVRHLRGPLAAGYLWLLVAYLSAEPSWPDRDEAGPLIDAFYRLGDFTSPAGQAIALSFLAYVAGAVSEALFNGPLGRLAIRLGMNLPARRMAALKGFVREELGVAYKSMRWAVVDAPRSHSPTDTTELAKSFARKFAPAFVDRVGIEGYSYTPLAYSHKRLRRTPSFWSKRRGLKARHTSEQDVFPDDRQVEQMIEATAAFVVERDLGSVEFRLLREHKDLYLEADRLRAEAEFRFAVAVPLLVLPVGVLTQEVAATSMLISAGAVGAAVVLYLSGLFRNRSANDLVVDAIVERVVVSPTVAAASEEAAPVVTAINAEAERRRTEAMGLYPGDAPFEASHEHADVPTRGEDDQHQTAES
jgi:hypothetical protein